MCCNDYYNYETISSNSVYTFTPPFTAMCLLLFKNLLWDAADRHLTIAFHSSFSCLTLCLQKIEKKKKKKKEQGAGGTQVRWEAPTSPLMWYKIAAGVQQERSMLSTAPITAQVPLPGRASCPWHLHKTNLMAHINSAWESERHRPRSPKKKKSMAGILHWYTSTLLKVRNLKLCQCKLDIKISIETAGGICSWWVHDSPGPEELLLQTCELML